MRRDGPSLIPRRRGASRRRMLAGLAFIATCVCVVVVNLGRWPPELGRWSASAQFAAILMGMLLAHELGHLAAARWVGMRLGLPWFIPFPLIVGTLGAIIVPEEAPRDRTRLAVMAVAGPLAGAGMLVLLMALLLPASGAHLAQQDLAVPIIWRMLGGDGASSQDPVQLGLWVGCLVTWVNLMPFGQLDGGHVWSACFPRYASHATWAVTLGFVFLSWWWVGWLLWVVALHTLGQRRPTDVRRPDVPLGRNGKVAGILALVLAVLFALPIPS